MSSTEQPVSYQGRCPFDFSTQQQATIQEAIKILQSSFVRGIAVSDSEAVSQFCQLKLAAELDERFGCLFLDNQHRLIAYEELFKGTINGAAVYPRVVVRRALELNAAAVIFTHNHPSGAPEPSTADISITHKLRDALNLVDVRTLDHIVVGSEGTVSMAVRGHV